jgi:hypothetical protein
MSILSSLFGKNKFLFASFLLLLPLQSRADIDPPGCLGSGLNVALFTSAGHIHVGDTIQYSILVFNGAYPACKATDIQLSITTPDGVTHPISLLRSTLLPGQSDSYNNVVSYVVRNQDVPSSSVLTAKGSTIGTIHQNVTNSLGGGNQQVNTIVDKPCIQLSSSCKGTVGPGSIITYSGSITNCGNTTLTGIKLTSFGNASSASVSIPTTLASGATAGFSGSWIPVTSSQINAGQLVVEATSQLASSTVTVTATADNGATCFDCHNLPFPGAVIDACGVCGGDGKSCLDCAGMPFGTAALDHCGDCNGGGVACELCIGTKVYPSQSKISKAYKVSKAAQTLLERTRRFNTTGKRCGLQNKYNQRAQELVNQINHIVKTYYLSPVTQGCSNILCTSSVTTGSKTKLRKIAQQLYLVQLNTKLASTAACGAKRHLQTVNAKNMRSIIYLNALNEAIAGLPVTATRCR